jgi:hypothetical protein
MPAQILNKGAIVNCSHSPGRATPKSSFARVKVAGQEVVTLQDLYSIAGCPLNTPCATGQWISGSIKVKAEGFPVAIFDGQSNCLPTNNPMMPVSAQTRVRAT